MKYILDTSCTVQELIDLCDTYKIDPTKAVIEVHCSAFDDGEVSWSEHDLEVIP